MVALLALLEQEGDVIPLHEVEFFLLSEIKKNEVLSLSLKEKTFV